jgi:hypothetical protein
VTLPETLGPEPGPPADGSVPSVAPRRDLAPRLGLADRQAVLVAAASRVVVLATVWAVGQLLTTTHVGVAASLGDRLTRWDVLHYLNIAQHGYGGELGTGLAANGSPLAAFFPGLPALMWVLHAAGIPWAATGPVIAAVSMAFVAVGLSRLALDQSVRSGWRAVLLLVCAPSAVFLAVGYTEAPFLALALWAWIAGRDNRWRTAGLLAAASACFRVTGLFLAAALAVAYLQSVWESTPPGTVRQRMRSLPLGFDVLWLSAPLLPLFALCAYHRHRSGDWLLWWHAEKHWGRSFTTPWRAWRTTWNAAFGPGRTTTDWAFSFALELVAVVVGVVLTVVLVRQLRLGEAVYVGLQVFALATSSYYLSVPRAALLWWPLWIGLARWTTKDRAALPWRLVVCVSVLLPFAIGYTAAYTQGLWSG